MLPRHWILLAALQGRIRSWSSGHGKACDQQTTGTIECGPGIIGFMRLTAIKPVPRQTGFGSHTEGSRPLRGSEKKWADGTGT